LLYKINYLFMNEVLLTTKEVAAHLNCTERTVQNLRDRGELAFVKVGRLIRYTKSQIDDYLKQQTITRFELFR
jgi:excisionase family DNA binding protein